MRLPSKLPTQPIVLVVDDTPANLTLMRNVLEHQSYKVLLATSGEKALTILDKITPDLILLDVMMPGIDGFDTIKHIKKTQSAHDVPVIFVTAKTEIEDIIHGFELGAVDYITKPIQRLELLARTKAHLKIRELIKIERMQSEQIRAIINNISDCVLVTDDQGQIQSANPATENLFGFSETALCRQNLAQLLNYQGSNESFIDILMTHDDHDDWWQQPIGKNSQGETFAIEVNVRQMFTDQPSFVVVIQDISLYRHEIDELHHLSKTDPLTNINNRRHFEFLLSQSWQHCKRSNQPLTILFIDVDYFKAFNDQYGHQEGDVCLQKIASVLVSVLSRAVDSVSRYGGEEFVSILSDTGAEGAQTVAQSMLEHVYELRIPHQFSQYGVVTISIGTTTCYFDADTVPEQSAKNLLKRADKALYEAKSHGRNRVKQA